MPEKANSHSTRTINERRLLNLIREAGPITRNELAKRAKISKVAVSGIINRLDNDGFILETGKGESTSKGGKRPTLLKLNPDNGYVIGILIKRGNITIALANIESTIKGIEQHSYKIDASIDEVISTIFTKIDFLLIQCNVSQEKLISIGIGMPGIIDYAKGELKYAVTLREWVNLPLASRFSSHYNVPTIIENDINTITLIESLLGAGRGYSNITCVLIESGIGSGIMLNGQLVRGETGNAGEIGYLDIDYCIDNNNHLTKANSNREFLGEFLSDVNLLDMLKKNVETEGSISQEELNQLTLKDLLILGDSGNEKIQKTLNQYANPLAMVCMNLIKTLNPGLLILCGFIIENSNYLFKKIEEILKQRMKNVPFRPGKIAVGELGENAGVQGAIALALQTVFEPPLKQTQMLNKKIY